MNTLTDLTPSMIMASGLKRISALVTQHGITSPQVWDAVVRWGGILDDVNHPDTTCRNCGHPVTYIAAFEKYVHSDRRDDGATASRHCVTHAGAEAAPKPLDQVYTEAELKQAKVRIVKANSLERTRLYDNQDRLTTAFPTARGLFT